jgi:hypothetical protein
LLVFERLAPPTTDLTANPTYFRILKEEEKNKTILSEVNERNPVLMI